MSQIKTNTAALQELLNTAANLPEPVDTSDATATSSKILSGYTAYVDNKMIAGNIPNNGSVSQTMDGINTKSVTIPAGYTSGGTVGLDNTIDNAVSAAIAALTEKGVEVPSGTNISGLAELISGISGEKVSCGVITFSSATAEYSWEHGLGVIPDYAAIYLSPGYYVEATHSISLRSIINQSSSRYSQDNYFTKTRTDQYVKDSTSERMSVTDTTVNVSKMTSNGNTLHFVAGKPYIWICATGSII